MLVVVELGTRITDIHPRPLRTIALSQTEAHPRQTTPCMNDIYAMLSIQSATDSFIIVAICKLYTKKL